MSKLRSLLAVPLLGLAGVTACASDPPPDPFGTEGNAKCEPGDAPSCKCKGGKSGTKSCDNGKLSSCDCSGATAAVESSAPAATAPRPVCTELASCDNLAPPPTFQPAQNLTVALVARNKAEILADLQAEVARGSDRARSLAAALDGAIPGEPTVVTALRQAIGENPSLEATVRRHVPELGFGSLEAYRSRFPLSFVTTKNRTLTTLAVTDSCAPSLRMRIAKITAHEDEDILTDDEIYCSVSATAKEVQELKITPKTPPLGNGESQTFNATETVFFGQGKPRDPGGNDIVIKYDCFEAEGNAGYAAMVGAAAKAAREYGRDVTEEGDENGYVATGANLIGTFLPLFLALDGDDHLYKAEQRIPAAQHKDLAKGATWEIKKSGKHFFSDWEWSLTMEAWGCSVNGSGTPIPAVPPPVK
jgi:hypothetical protein